MAHNRLSESLATYLYARTDALCDLEPQINSLPTNGNVAFNDRRPQALLGIILAAHDEPARYISNLLPKIEQRMYDDNMPPTSLIVSCNAPEGQQDTAQYRANIEAIKGFQSQSNSQDSLAVSFYEIAYPEHTTQGRRRRDLGDVAMMHTWRLYSPNAFPHKMSFMMLDVDTEDIAPESFTQLHQPVMRGQPVVAAGVEHAVDPAFPRLAKALHFGDRLYSLLPEGGWDGYMMFDLATLADNGSYPTDINLSEVQALSKTCSPHRVPVSKAVFTTSPRRLHAQYLAGKTVFQECWPSFSDTEDYRMHPPKVDISEEQLRAIGLASMNFSVVYTLDRMKEYGHKVLKQTKIVAKSNALREIAIRIKQANEELGMGLEDTSYYQGIQEAATKYRIV